MIPRKLLRGEKFNAIFDLFNSLIDYLHRSKPVAGPGIKISRTASGTVFEAAGAQHLAPAYHRQFGSFIVTPLNSGKLSVSPGFANVNGKTFNIPAQEMALPEGSDSPTLLCLHAGISDTGELLTPELAWHEFAPEYHPIANVTAGEHGGLCIEQFPVAVAIFMLTKECIYARKD